MRKTVRFKLSEQETKLADALRRQLQEETGAIISMEDIIKRHFVNWMYSNLIKPGESDGISSQTEVIGDTAEVQVTAGSDALEQPAQDSQS